LVSLFQKVDYYCYGVLVTLAFILILPFIEEKFVNFLGGFSVFTIGILHGANDLRIISKRFKNHIGNLYIKSLVLYALVVLIGGAFFFIAPSLSLLIFVLFSSYHFGEQHWSDDIKQNIMGLFFYSIYGALVFFLIFSTQHLEVAEVMEKISGKDDFLHFINLPKSFNEFINSYLAFEFFVGVTFALSVLFILNLIYSGLISKYLFRELILLMLLFILFYLSTLLFAFAFYFVVWHSIPSLRDQLYYLHGEVNLKSIKKYLKHSILYWFLSIFSLFMIYKYVDFESTYFMSLFFSFLAAISFPHVIVIGIMKSE